jgi:uncharacterized protein involved in exopolysaccharide biosynthesis
VTLRARDIGGVLWRGRWLIAQAVVVVPFITVLVSAHSPERFQSSATLEVSGRNTGTGAGDVEQARGAVLKDRSMAERTIAVTGVVDVSATGLVDAIDMSPRPADARLELTVTHGDRDHAQALCAEFARQLARDQFATVVERASAPVRVAPRSVRNGVLSLGAAVPFGVALALVFDAARRRRSRET